jgi:photosystem II stability/assembly factor-like uncharacterized protein
VGGLPTNRTVNGFAVNPQDSKIMFVAMRDGFFKSADAGASWARSGKDLKNLAAVTINPTKRDEVYVSAMDGTIYVSTDGGMKWEKQ